MPSNDQEARGPWWVSLARTIPKIRTGLQLVAFIVLAGLALLLNLRELQIVPTILVIGSAVPIIIAARVNWGPLLERNQTVILTAFAFLALCVIGPILIALLLVLRPTDTPPAPNGHRLSNEAKRPLGELIDTVRVRDNVRFVIKGQTVEAEQRVRELVPCFDGKIRGPNWGTVFCQLARHFEACLECSTDAAGTLITLTLKDEAKSPFRREEGCDVCRP